MEREPTRRPGFRWERRPAPGLDDESHSRQFAKFVSKAARRTHGMTRANNKAPRHRILSPGWQRMQNASHMSRYYGHRGAEVLAPNERNERNELNVGGRSVFLPEKSIWNRRWTQMNPVRPSRNHSGMECADLSALLAGDLSPSNAGRCPNLPDRWTRPCFGDKSPKRQKR